MKALVLAHVLATLTMLGVIWTIQLVHYPLMADVGAAGFARYEARHRVRITWLVFPAMLVELATAGALVFWRPSAWPAWALWLGLGLVGVAWLSTAFVQVPLHARLARGFDGAAHVRLVASNAIRTTAWTLRAGLVLWLLGRLL